MPLLQNKFNTKKTPPRRSLSLNNLNKLESSIREEEYGADYGQPAMRIAGQLIKFDAENGIWISESAGSSGGVSQREFIKLRKQNEGLLEENNLLKLKVEILLDLLSQTTAEKQILEQDLGEYGSGNRKSNKRR